MRMLGQLLPTEVVIVATYELGGEDGLFPIEAQQIAGAILSRRREFATGRRCARCALARLGLPQAPVPMGSHRGPAWPLGIVGSITHCQGYYAAAVARHGVIEGLGIDAEVNKSLPRGVRELTSFPGEWVGLSDTVGISWPALLFSARESVFKLWHPLTQRSLDYRDVSLRIEPCHQRFSVKLVSESAPVLSDLLARVEGRFAWSKSHIFTCAWLVNSASRAVVAHPPWRRATTH
jgi:4'-phosphopantetheinyl transferase EntD